MWSATAFLTPVHRWQSSIRGAPRGVPLLHLYALATVVALALTACGATAAPDEKKRLTAVAAVRATAVTVAERTEGLSEYTEENYAALIAEVRVLQSMMDGLDPNAPKRQYLIPFHAIKASDDDGRRAAEVSPEEVAKWVDKSNEVFSAANVRFAFNPDPRGPDWTETRDTALNNLESKLAHGRYAAQISEQYPGKVVAIFRHGPGRTPVEDAYSNLFEKVLVMPGFATTRWNIGKDASGRWVTGQNIWMLAHELGHYFGLPHTFPDAGLSTNLNAALFITMNGGGTDALDGDSIPDTPPDPGWHYYTGRGFDPCKGPATFTIDETFRGRPMSWELSPDRHNVMSYYGCEPVHMTPMQAQVVQARMEKRGFRPVD